MTVKELIEKLEQFDPNMLVGVNYDVSSPTICIRTWVDGNYPYDRPDFDYVSIE